MKRTPSSAATRTRESRVVDETALARTIDNGVAPNASPPHLNPLLQEHERDRISRDLHDCVLQSLYAIGLSIETARRITPCLPSEAASSTAQAVDQLNDLIRVVRIMIQRLEGEAVPTGNFLSELRSLITTYEAVGHLHIDMDLPLGIPDGFTHKMQREVLHLVREALSNCVRHAQSTQATVSLRLDETSAQLTVSDNGIGFSPEQQGLKGYGLANMAARARLLGGTLDVQSRPGEGTRICAGFAIEPTLAAR